MVSRSARAVVPVIGVVLAIAAVMAASPGGNSSSGPSAAAGPPGASPVPPAAPPAPAARDEIQRFVRNYIDASNGTDPAAVMDMVSRSPEVSMAAMGAVRRGLDAIRSEVDKLAEDQGTHQVTVETMDITPLGPAHALVVATISIDLSMGENRAQLRGAMTLVLEKTTGRWRVLHEHDSMQFPQGDFPGGEMP